jgi:uncharacterized membrane protein YhaH (DUF805 family)
MRSPFWNGRGGRIEFWAVFASLMCVGLIMPSFKWSVAGFMSFAAIRRFHDFGQSGWWTAAPYVAGLVVLIVTAASPVLGALLFAGFLIAGVGFVGFVGLMPGDPHPNRYGPPQVWRRRKPRDAT